jgi:hypothetical protein
MSAGRLSPMLAVAALMAAAQPGAAQPVPDGFVIVEGHVYGLPAESSGSILLNERTGQTWLLAQDEDGRAVWYLLKATDEPVPIMQSSSGTLEQ